MVGLLPGYFWASWLLPWAGWAERLAYSMALSMVLVPVMALALARLLGGGVTLTIAVASPLIVAGIGAGIYLKFGPPKASEGAISRRAPAPLGVLALAPITTALALVVGSDLADLDLFWLAGSCWGWPTDTCVESGEVQGFMIPIGTLVVAAGAFYLLGSRRGPESQTQPSRQEPPAGYQRLGAGALGRRLLPGAVFLLVLARGYIGPILRDWPYIRGLDHYSHTIMANLMLSEGDIEPYLIYPPGFHTMTAVISRLGGLEPMEIFPALGPALLLLPVLSLYVVARRLWGWEVGIVAAFFSGVLMGGSYYYFNDSMYPNLVTSQFLLVLSLAALFQMYSSPSVRNGLLLALLGSAVVFYHQVSSLYLALLLAVVATVFLPCLLRRDRRKGLALLSALALLGVLGVVYAWYTYNLPQVIGGLTGGSNASETGNAVEMAIGTQERYGVGYLIGAIISQPVAWLGLLGAVLLVADLRIRSSTPEVLVRGTLLAWCGILFVGSLTSYSGFPQRFGRDLGMPLALLGALALVVLLRSLLRQRGRKVAVFAASLAVVLAGSLIGLRAVQSFDQAAGPSPHLVTTPQIAAGGKWLEEHNQGGNIMVSPQENQVPSRMMLAMGDYSALQSFTALQIANPKDLPPHPPSATGMWCG